VSFYVYRASDSKLTTITPWAKKNGSSEAKLATPVANLLKGLVERHQHQRPVP
jgi:hypothetical protein